jgi:hypothetical protein
MIKSLTAYKCAGVVENTYRFLEWVKALCRAGEILCDAIDVHQIAHMVDNELIRQNQNFSQNWLRYVGSTSLP